MESSSLTTNQVWRTVTVTAVVLLTDGRFKQQSSSWNCPSIEQTQNYTYSVALQWIPAHCGVTSRPACKRRSADRAIKQTTSSHTKKMFPSSRLLSPSQIQTLTIVPLNRAEQVVMVRLYSGHTRTTLWTHAEKPG